MNKVLNEKELGAELGLSVWTVRRLRIQEGCPHFTIGSRIFYRLGTVLDWLATKEQANVKQKTEPETCGRIRVIK